MMLINFLNQVGTVLSAAQTLFSALQCVDLKEVLSLFGYQCQLDDLQRSVKAIEACLRDAEAKQELCHEDQHCIQELKDAIFEADDLFDEFVTLAEQKLLLKANGKLPQQVSNFFTSSKNPLSVAYKMSRGIKGIKKKLDAIAYNKQFSFKIDSEPARKRRPETCSYINEVEVIGREHDLEYIVRTLLASNDQSDVFVLSIVGIGGLGKTALAQLVFNSPRVTTAFPLRMWTCVSDQDQKELNVKDILHKILASITRRNPDQGSTMDQVQSQLREELAGKKYLLVLDDVWTEKRDQWCELMKYLLGGERGSCIVVTTRSQQTAKITGGLVYKLLGLSKENSWQLFKRIAFTSEQSNPPDDLVNVGQKIVDGCAQVPLAIKVAGSLLYGQEKSKWQAVEKIGLANIRDEDNGIMPVLKLSFHHLKCPLKNCFRYCALFPKDYVIDKAMLIRLWMAQGYIVPLDNFQSIEDAGEEYFSILLRRCFFQDIARDKSGEIISCKIHDLMHDLAQNMSGKEIYALDTFSGNIDKYVRHLSIFKMSQYEKLCSSDNTSIRSILFFHHEDHLQLPLGALLGNFRCLRALDLSGKNIKCLPDSIGELVHLRYIDLSTNIGMVVLPNSITKLSNLQTLILHHCWKLRELPKDMNGLGKLRVLDIDDCYAMRSLARSLGKLTSLHTLKGVYRVGEGGCKSWKQWFDGLEGLKTLINLKGELKINMWWPKNAKNDVKSDRMEGSYLRSLEYLDHIALRFYVEDSGRAEDEGMTLRMMEEFQPHYNLKKLTVWRYHGVKMAGWTTLLSHLVSLSLNECKELTYLPCLGNLGHLKSLVLDRLPNLEYMEEDSQLVASNTAEEVSSFFTSLEELELYMLPKFQGWRKRVATKETSHSSDNKPQLQRCLSQLKRLIIDKCPELTCILRCPMLETLTLNKFNETLQIFCTKTDDKISKAAAAIENPATILAPKLREVSVTNASWLNSMPIKSLLNIQCLVIYGDGEMVELPNCMQYMSALHSLEFWNCKALKAMPNWIPQLTSLRKLTVANCPENLKKRCYKDPPGEYWPYIQHIPDIKF